MDVQFSFFNTTLTFTEPFVFNADERVHLYKDVSDVNDRFVKLNDDVYYLENESIFTTPFDARFRSTPENVLFFDDALAYVAAAAEVSVSDISNADDWKFALREKIAVINDTISTLVVSTLRVPVGTPHPALLEHSSGVKYLPKAHELNIAYQVYQKALRYNSSGGRTALVTNAYGDSVSVVRFLHGDTLNFDLTCDFFTPVPTKIYRFTYHLVSNYFTYPSVPITSYTGWKSSGWQENSDLPMIVLPINLTKTKTSLQTLNVSEMYTRQSTDYDTELLNLNIFYNPRGIFLFPYVSSSVTSKKYVVIISTLVENSTNHLFNTLESENNMFPSLSSVNYRAYYKQTFYIASNKTATFPLSFDYLEKNVNNDVTTYTTRTVTAATAQEFTGNGKFLTADNKIVVSQDNVLKLADVGLNFGDYNGYPYEGRKAVADYKLNIPYYANFTLATTRSYLLLRMFNTSTNAVVDSLNLTEPITIRFEDVPSSPTLTVSAGTITLSDLMTQIQNFSPANLSAGPKGDGIIIYMLNMNIAVNSLTISDTTIFRIDPQVNNLQFFQPYVCLPELPIFAWELTSPITFFGNSLTGTVAINDIVTMLNARNNGIVVSSRVGNLATFLMFTSLSSFVIDETTFSEYYRLLGFKQPVSSELFPARIIKFI